MFLRENKKTSGPTVPLIVRWLKLRRIIFIDKRSFMADFVIGIEGEDTAQFLEEKIVKKKSRKN